MSNVVRGITCFLHGTDGYGFNKILFLLALNIVQQMVDGFGNICLGPTGTYLVTEAGDELCQVIQFLRVWKVVDTVREYLGLLAFRYATDFSATVRLASNMNSSTNLLASLETLK